MLLELVVRLLAAAQETRVERASDGGKVEYAVARDDQGNLVKQGAYHAWFADGTLRAEGEFTLGKESGRWTLHHADGSVAERGSYADGLKSGPWETFFAGGAPESSGSYVRGARSGRWSFWRADGTQDRVESGIYELVVYRSKEDGRHYRGYLVDNVRQGTWTTFWPDRSKQLEGRLVAGRREGPWTFFHPDGAPSALLLSGEYAGGARASALAPIEPPPFDPDRFPALEPAPGGWPSRRAELTQHLVAAAGALALDDALRAELERSGLAALPVVLDVLLTLDPERAADRAALAFLERAVLRPLCGGHALSSGGELDAPAARELLRAWLSLWALTHADAGFWEAVRAQPADGGRDPLRDPPLLERDPRFEPSAAAAPVPASTPVAEEPAAPLPAPYRLRSGKEKEAALRFAPGGTKEAVAAGLRWLAAHQSADGHWSNAGFAAECGKLAREPCSAPGRATYDVGATALALLALLGDGNTPDDGPEHARVSRGLAWLVQQQASTEGLIGTREAHDFLYCHALATAALCEGFGLGAAELRAPAERALRFIELGRHPEGGWRYDVPATEKGDTSVTGWAVHALVTARRAGLEVDTAALEGALRWIEAMSEPRTGRIGYSDRGELSSRDTTNLSFPRELGEAMTGVGLFSRILLGQTPGTTPLMAAHARVILAKPPRLDRKYGGDSYSWFAGTCALRELEPPGWDEWKEDLRKAVIVPQVKRGDAQGSWDPLGPWGEAMGRVTSTALMVVTLECFYRYPRVLEGR